MADSIQLRIDDHSADFLKEVNRKSKLVLAEMGEIIEKHAKGDCPVDTGNLRNSLTYALGGEAPKITHYSGERPPRNNPNGPIPSGTYSGNAPSDPSPDKMSVYIGTNVYYAVYVELIEYYRHYVGKAHFLRDAATSHKDEMREKAIMIYEM